MPEALTDRKQALELKMNILVMQVQTGAITPENYPLFIYLFINNNVQFSLFLSKLYLMVFRYVEMLQTKVEQEMALAKKLVALGKKDWAKFPLTRAKIMKSEIESASAEDDE